MPSFCAGCRSTSTTASSRSANGALPDRIPTPIGIRIPSAASRPRTTPTGSRNNRCSSRSRRSPAAPSRCASQGRNRRTSARNGSPPGSSTCSASALRLAGRSPPTTKSTDGRNSSSSVMDCGAGGSAATPASSAARFRSREAPMKWSGSCRPISSIRSDRCARPTCGSRTSFRRTNARV